MKYFTKTIDKYFASWILPDTWHTGHPLDMARFYRFIIAIHRISKPVKRPPVDLSDPCFNELHASVRSDMAKTIVGAGPNPRTYNEKALKRKILHAVKQNHPNFNESHAGELVDEYVKKAMIILKALSAVKFIAVFPDRNIERWEPELK